MTRCLALLAITLFSATARAGDKVTIEAKHAAGDAYDVRRTVTMKLSGSVQGQPLSTRDERVQGFREKTVEVKDGLPVRAERTYKTYEQTIAQTEGLGRTQTEEHKNPIVGKALTLARKSGKVQLESKPEAGDLDAGDLAFCTHDAEALLPPEPAAVGDEWDVPKWKLVAALGLDGMRASGAKCTLAEIADRDGARIARIGVELTEQGVEAGTKSSADLKGSLLFDLSAGRPLSLSLKGTIKLAMGVVAVEGPVEVETTYAPAK